jgi:hypothetical protein
MTLCTILFIGLALFCTCLVIHTAIWRLFPARRQGSGVVIILVMLPILGFILAFVASRVFQDAVPRPEPVLCGLAYLLHLSLSGAYCFVYTALTGFSPSIGILEKVEASMPRGLKRDELAPKWFTNANLSGARLRNLVDAGLVLESANCLRLSSRGWVIARCFLAFRRFLGLTDVAQG